jgi:lipopolysaccharide export system protein LptA
MRFNFRPGGHDLQDGETVGESKLVLVPLDGKAGRRIITAGQFLMGFDAGSRLESVRGRARSRIVFEPAPTAPPGSLPQETSSELLEANFDPGDGALKAVEQTGDFHFREGDRQASSDEARYAFPSQILTLTGRPQLWDATTRVKADRILFDLRADKAEAVGKVQSTQSPMASQPLGSPSGQSVAARGDAINILADRMVAVQHDQFIHYEGHVRAWHGQDVIDSASLDVYKAQRRVSSGSRVLTSHLQPALRETAPIDPASSPPPHEPRPVTICADRWEYVDEERKASYRGNVQLQAENTTLQATALDVFFSESSASEGQEIERAVADGHVLVTQPNRRATGEHADYDAAPGKIVLTGGPPTVYDAQKGFTTGQRLTFYIRDDRLVVDGGNTSPTLTKHSVAQ